jgi:hypothetical protein
MTVNTDGTPVTVLDAHQCQNGCGRIADVIIVTLADSAVDIFCQVCHLMMMMAVAADLPDTAPAEAIAADPQPV